MRGGRAFLRGLLVAVLVLAGVRVFAQSSGSSPNASAVLPGTYTIATLPPCSQNQGRYAFDTDLGGGADMVLCDGTYWKHIRMGVVTPVTISGGTLNITPLVSPPIIQLASSSLITVSSTLNIVTTNLYPSYLLHIVIPSGVIGTATALGVSVNGTGAIPLASGTWEDVQWNGSALVEIGKGTL